MNSLMESAGSAVNALKCELASEVLRSSGSLRLRVTGWSMLPSVMPGDTLIIERVNDRASPGDIVLFGRNRRLFVHRVISVAGSGGDMRLITQGDGMRRPDPPGEASELLGKVSLIVRNGRGIEPRRRPGIAGRAVAALVRVSDSAARIVVGVHKMRQSSKEPVVTCQS